MPAEFNWWLLIVGLVIGAGAVWLILVEFGRHEDEVSEREIAAEATRIADELRGRGESVDEDTVAAVIELHRERLRHPSTAEVEADDEVDDEPPSGG